MRKPIVSAFGRSGQRRWSAGTAVTLTLPTSTHLPTGTSSIDGASRAAARPSPIGTRSRDAAPRRRSDFRSKWSGWAWEMRTASRAPSAPGSGSAHGGGAGRVDPPALDRSGGGPRRARSGASRGRGRRSGRRRLVWHPDRDQTPQPSPVPRSPSGPRHPALVRADFERGIRVSVNSAPITAPTQDSAMSSIESS